MSSDFAIRIENAGKCYQIYRRPEDRLKQALSFGRGRFYTEYWAFRGVTFEVRQGESVAIIGRNGAGKSSLLQAVAGTSWTTEGSVSTRGRVVALLELGTGFNPEFTGRENVYLSGSILGLTDKQIDARVEAIEHFADIGDFMDQPVKLYSSGMYARLAFGVATHVDADILIVDEILAVGDAAFTQKCMRFIHTFRERGTLLFVSHDAGAVNRLCDRAVWLDGGRTRMIGPAKDVSHAYLAALYGQESGSSFQIGGARAADGEGRPISDPRQADLRNDVAVFDFNPEGPWFGQRGATLRRARLLSTSGQELSAFAGGEEVVLEVLAEAHIDLTSPIVGFYVKDRLGQTLFGDNTFLTYRCTPVSIIAGQNLTARFRFQMPYLPSGHFALNVAIATGTQSDHIQHHWMEDALFFSVQSSHVAKGLVGIPMLDIGLDVEWPADAAAA